MNNDQQNNSKPIISGLNRKARLTQDEVVEGFCKLPHTAQYVSVFEAGVRFAEAHYGIDASLQEEPSFEPSHQPGKACDQAGLVAVFDEKLGRPRMLAGAQMLEDGQSLYAALPAAAELSQDSLPGTWQSHGAHDSMRHPEESDLIGGEADCCNKSDSAGQVESISTQEAREATSKPLTDAEHEEMMRGKSTLDYGRAVEASVRIRTREQQPDSKRLDWIASHPDAAHERNEAEHWIVAWLCQGEPGNNGANGKFVAVAPSFRGCIDKFLAGDVARVNA